MKNTLSSDTYYLNPERTKKHLLMNSFSKRMLSLFITILLQSVQSLAQKDLPNAASDLQTIPAGSFIVPMDTLLQNIVAPGQAPFNLKAYGLINEFLQNGIPVKWVIKSEKNLNDIDFTANAERFAPGFVGASNIDFRGGPFIVPDTVVPCGLSTSQIIQKFGNDVTVYRMLNSAVADVKYTITHQPKIAVFNNGGNELIHTKILDAAGITDYDVMDAADIANLINCYTFVSEPHADVEDVSLEVIEGVKAFVLNGGNFLAQCHAIDTYENRGFFQTTTGVTDINTTVSHLYENPDMSCSQFHGTLKENEGGSVHNWTLAAGSSWKPETYKIVSHLGSDTVVATGAHLTAPSAPGGNVFYLGGHDYSKGGKKGTIDLSNLARVNALRMYLNAAFIPSGNSNGAWAKAGSDTTTSSCMDSVMLGCTLTGPPGSSFSWTPANGLSCTDCPNPLARPEVTTTYIVQVTNGCTATDTVTVSIAPSPVSSFSFDTVCSGRLTTFTNESVNASYFKWIFEDSTSKGFSVSSEKDPLYKFSKAGQFKVTLVAGTDSICADTTSHMVTVDPAPVISVNSPIICTGNEALLKVTGAESYQWPNGQTGNSFAVSPLATTSYKVTGISAEGCVSEEIAVVTVVADIVTIVKSKDVSCNGLSDGAVTVEVTGGMPDYKYLWNTEPVQTTSEISGLKPGKLMVIVSDSVGCRDTAYAEIKEPEPLQTVINIKDITCPGGNDGTGTAIITGGTPPYNYIWNTIPQQLSEVARELKAGVYILSVKDSNNCETSDTIVIREPAQFTKNAIIDSVKCAGGTDGSATLDISGGSPPYNFQWNTWPVQKSHKAIGLTAGVYTAFFKDSLGCHDSILVTVAEPSPLNTDITLVHPDCNKKGSASVSASGGTKPYSYLWNTIPATTNVSVTNLPAGTYNLKITDANKCSKDTVIRLYDPPIPVAGFSTGNICVGQTITFNDQSAILPGHYPSDIVSWKWYLEDMTTPFSSDPNPSYVFENDGQYKILLEVTTDKGCTDTAASVADVYPIPVPDFSFTGAQCAGTCISFTDLSVVKSGNISSWSWNFGESESSEYTSAVSNPIHCYEKSGKYRVALTVTSHQGCTATVTKNDFVDIYPVPEPDLGEDIKVCFKKDGEVIVPLNAGKGIRFLWTPTGETTEKISVNAPGSYKVNVTNEWGCTAADSVNVKNVCPPEVYVGNAFSPDNDGINDYFTFYTTNVGKFQLLIFNRWGEIIFESRDKTHFWDGLYRMEPMPVGVYAWVLTYEGDSEEYLGPYKMQGSITVVR